MSEKEFNQIVQQHSDALYRFALKNIKVVEEAQEIVQTAFEKLWLNRNNVELEKSKSYLFRVAYNYLIDMIRKQRKEAEWSQVLEQKPATEVVEFKDLKRIIDQALNSLSEAQRNAIMLRDYEGYSYAEIGEIMNISESQVKINIFRGRKQMQQLLGKMEYYI
jgi:RNA polymerase sigma-70 factor (ECF subfamily)